MKKQGLIAVDLDGTLFDTVAVNAESYRRALESFGFTLDYDYYAAYCNGRHYRAFLQPLMGGSPSAEDVERVHDLKKQYYAASMDIARKNEALFVILEALRPTHYLAVITTGSRQNATEMLDHFHSLLDGFDWLHLSGITPALGQNCADFVMACLKKAKEKGLTVSFDGNFRSTLWAWEEARDYCTQCLPYVDVLFGIEPYHLWKDDADHAQGDWKDGVPLQPSYEQQDEIFQRFVERYPNIKCIARHVRYAHSGSENSLKAFMWYEDHTFESKLFTFNILDRVGGGDAFASGLIYAMLHNYKPMDMVNFAVASSAIKHTIHGDANITGPSALIPRSMSSSSRATCLPTPSCPGCWPATPSLANFPA